VAVVDVEEVGVRFSHFDGVDVETVLNVDVDGTGGVEDVE